MARLSPDQPARDFTAYARDWDMRIGFVKLTDGFPSFAAELAWHHFEAIQSMLAYEGELP